MRIPAELRAQAQNLERMVDDAAAAGLQSISHMMSKRDSSTKCDPSTGNCYTSDSATIPIVLGTV